MSRLPHEDPAPLLQGLLPRALQLAEAQHVRSAQLAPGISALGRCRRQAAYGLAGVLPDLGYEPAVKPAAWLGTWAHAGLLPLLRQLLAPARTEMKVAWSPREASPTEPEVPTLPGHVDLYRRRSALVLDVKTVSPYQLDEARRQGVRWRDEQQVTGYGQALRQQGKPVQWLGVLYVGTATSMLEQDTEGHLWLGQPDPAVEQANVDWWTDVTEGAAEPEPEPPAALRDEDGPGLSIVCDGCRWLRACWGPDAVPGRTGPQAVHTDPEVAEAAAEYDAAKVAAKIAKQQQDAAKARLEATAPESTRYTDPDRPELGAWTVAWGKGREQLDQGEARRLLEQAGIPVPLSRTRGSISVRPAPAETSS